MDAKPERCNLLDILDENHAPDWKQIGSGDDLRGRFDLESFWRTQLIEIRRRAEFGIEDTSDSSSAKTTETNRSTVDLFTQTGAKELKG
jgi:hypothetical protein